ncbi:MAG: endonuclease/exonuclease/phosphatase family protein [Acidimicrobiales bacterium]
MMAWAAVVLAAVVLSLRWVDSDSSRLITLTAAGPALTLGAVVIVGLALAATAAVSRSDRSGRTGVRPYPRALTVAWMALAVAGAVVYTPVDAVVACRARPAPNGAVTVVAGNIYYANNDVEPLLALAAAHEADVLVVPELNEVTGATLAANRERYPYQRLIPYREGANGIGVISRLPLHDVETIRIGPSRAVRAIVESPSGPVTLLAVHLANPVTGPPTRWRQGLSDLESLVDHTPGPVIVAGDFNATAEHVPFRALLSGTGLHDAHDDAGCGWDGTWPTRAGGAIPITGVARIDHVLLRADWQATRVNTAYLTGSDHAAVVATVAPAPG